MDHACADRTCAFCKATASKRNTRPMTPAYRGAMLQTVSNMDATRDLTSWARLQEMQEAFSNRTQLEELEKMALIDRASGLSNSRTWLREYSREFARARRRRSHLSICMIEITIQPDVTRQHSALDVDAILRSAGSIIQAALRETDTAGRYQKNTIAVVLPDCDPQGALIFAERMRGTLHNEIRTRQGHWGVSVRLAVGSFPMHAADKDALLNKVSMALTAPFDATREILQAV